jgi:N-acetyldiaminopimelate deacetylase
MKDIIQHRQALHRIPELAFAEHKTQHYLLEQLRSLPHLTIHTAARTGLIAEYCQGSGPYLLFRADMDALPITETTHVDWASTHPGRMHACGHDMHMAILLGLIQRIVSQKPVGNFLFVFQPAEESKGGASYLLNSGILDGYDIKAAFALHVSGTLPVGTISSRPGPFFAATRELDVQFAGKSAHVAYSHNAPNALAAATWFYQEFKRISAAWSPKELIADFGLLQSGTVRNVIADKARLEGTLRTFDNAVQKEVCALLEDAVTLANARYKTSGSISYPCDYHLVDNNPQLFTQFAALIDESPWQLHHAQPVMAGEDFGYFSQHWPSLLFWLGADDGSHHDLHTPNFLPSEEALEVGVDVLCQLANKALK